MVDLLFQNETYQLRVGCLLSAGLTHCPETVSVMTSLSKSKSSFGRTARIRA